jgi:hypothetical protein
LRRHLGDLLRIRVPIICRQSILLDCRRIAQRGRCAFGGTLLFSATSSTPKARSGATP